jgi:hypothetical protein
MPGLDQSRGGSQPVLTFYDDATGERTELSAATLDNWVAKTANLIVDGHGLGPGDTAAVLLPPHWLTAAVLLGCRAAGLVTVTGGPAHVAFVTPETDVEARDVEADDVYVVGLSPFATPLPGGPPPGTADYNLEVRAYGDRFAGLDPRPPARGERVLVDADTYPDPVDWLLAPLDAGASIVLCRHLDPAKLADRAAAEQVTRLQVAPGSGPGRQMPPATRD